MYAITGHTAGIGKWIFEHLQPNCIGFSKSTGYDLTQYEARKRVVKECADCSVFINNAPAAFGQSLMLLDIWRAWRDTDKTIINVGSRIADDGFVLRREYSHLLEYATEKRTLKRLHEDLVLLDYPVKLVYKSFSYVGTEKILKKYPHAKETDYISVAAAGELILS